MDLAKVVGTIVATQKDEKIEGFKILIGEGLTPDGRSTGEHFIALDTVGAGQGEVVLIVRGSSARQTKGMANYPVDASIVGIVDTVELGGEIVYQKFES